MKIHPLLPVLGFALLLISSCKTSEQASEPTLDQMIEDEQRSAERERTGVQIDPNRPLIDHLRQFPSLNIMNRSSGYDVRMRGHQSISQPDLVLFVINNTPVGQSYDHTASMINMYNVERIEVLSPGFAQQRYGERGMFGAVVITTRD
ncbi:MAG: Plug domain-containing protein [Balneolaceae bacterium]